MNALVIWGCERLKATVGERPGNKALAANPSPLWVYGRALSSPVSEAITIVLSSETGLVRIASLRQTLFVSIAGCVLQGTVDSVLLFGRVGAVQMVVNACVRIVVLTWGGQAVLAPFCCG